MANSIQFGIKAFEQSYQKVKRAIQCPHIYKTINKTTVREADSWASAKWGKPMDYLNILMYVGVQIIDD